MAPPSARDIALAFADVGTRSIGGGTTTLYLIRAAVERRGWISRREFTEALAFSQLSPGVHLVALAALIGHRLAGIRGVLSAVGGMMVPAAAITIALTAVLAASADHPLARAALAGVGPVTAGMTIGLGIDTARAAVRRGTRGALDVLVLASAFVLLVREPASAVAVVLGAAALGAVALGRERPTSGRPPE